MELQQNLNLITRILKQTVGLQHKIICREGFILHIKGRPYFFSFTLLEICNIALNQRYMQSLNGLGSAMLYRTLKVGFS